MFSINIKGKIIKGRGVGKKIDAPTANIKLNKSYQMPPSGVFASLIIVKNKKYKAAVFIGPRLTFNLKKPTIEAAIIGFSGDLYGEEVELKIGEKIREVEKFESVEELKRRILRDMALVESL